MSRPRRHSPGGMVFHVLNRGVGRRLLFTKDEDFLAFERVVEETLRTRRIRLCAYCLMPNHWHFVVWPERDGDLPAFMQQVTNTHVKRWKEHRHEIGYGHHYQGRYKCFPVETQDYFYQVVRYVERKALRANLVEQAESWRWSSLRRAEREDTAFPILSTWPLPRPTDWLQLVNQPQTEAQVSGGVAVLRQSRSALRRSQLGHRHGRAIGARMHGSAPWKTEETIVGLPRLLVLSVFSRFGGCHLSDSRFCGCRFPGSDRSSSRSSSRSPVFGGKGKWAVRGPGIDHHSNVSPSSIARVVSSNASCGSSTSAPR